MIDNENLIFDKLSKAIRDVMDCHVVGVEITDTPPYFPAVSIVQVNSSINGRYSTFGKVDNVAEEEYKFDIYSNLESQKEAKQQAKDIISVIDENMSELFYARSFCQPIPSADNKYTRYVVRYKKTDVV